MSYSVKEGSLNGKKSSLHAVLIPVVTDSNGNAQVSVPEITGRVYGIESTLSMDLEIRTKFGNDLMAEYGLGFQGRADFEVPSPIVGGVTILISNGAVDTEGLVVLYVE